jgi:CelD/BcsL family acetyltransferase involved in cellulose biosynthesis
VDAVTRRVVELEPRDPRWEPYVREHTDALVYHHPAWLATLHRAYGHEPTVLAVESDAGELLGVLPLMRKTGAVTGRKLSSLPHTEAAGPLASDAEASRALVRGAVDTARAQRSARLEIRTAAPLADFHPLEPTGAGTRYVLPLPTGGEVRFGSSRNHGRIRWSVRKAARSGVEVREATDLRDLRRWYRLYLETMRDLVVPPRPFRFFRAAWELLRPAGLMRLLLAERRADGDSRIAAGSMFLMFGTTTVYAYNGRRRADLGVRPNDVLQWHAIHQAAETGMEIYDFGEVGAAQAGLSEFKAKWGAQPVPLHAYQLDGRRGRRPGDVTDPDPPAWARSLWRRLPLDVTAAVGTVASRYL